MKEIHPYATDSSERDQWAIYIAIVAIIVGYGLHIFIEAYHQAVPLWLWWIEIPGPIGVYLALRAWMDESGWTWVVFHKLRWVRIPNLAGTWRGKVKSSFDQMATEYDCTIVIKQTWTRIAIVLSTRNSRSENLVAGILINGVDEATLVYEFRNEPTADAPAKMEGHHGHATLRLERGEGEDTLVGEYYSGRGRLNIGTMCVKRRR